MTFKRDNFHKCCILISECNQNEIYFCVVNYFFGENYLFLQDLFHPYGNSD